MENRIEGEFRVLSNIDAACMVHILDAFSALHQKEKELLPCCSKIIMAMSEQLPDSNIWDAALDME